MTHDCGVQPIPFLERLVHEGVAHCVLRGHEDLPSLHHDLDIAVLQQDYQRFKQLLLEFADSEDLVMLSVVTHWGCRQHRFVDSGYTGNRFLQVDAHLHGEGWRGLVYLDSSQVVASAVRGGSIIRSADDVDFAARLLTSLLAGGAVRRKHAARLSAYAARDREAAVLRLRPAFGARLSSRVVDLVASADWSGVDSTAAALRRALVCRRLSRHPVETLGSVFAFWRDEIRLIRQTTGVFVCVFGPDGAGKTTLAREVAGRIWWAFGREVRYFHGRPPILKALVRSIPEGGGMVSRASHAIPRWRISRAAVSALRLCKSVVLYQLGYWFRILPLLHRETLVVGDRYYYEYYANPNVMQFYGPRRWAETAGRFIPQPDILLLVGGDPQTIASRKCELSVCETQRQVELLGEIAADFVGGDVLILDGTGNLEDTVDSVCAAILCRLSAWERHGG